MTRQEKLTRIKQIIIRNLGTLEEGASCLDLDWAARCAAEDILDLVEELNDNQRDQVPERD